jgi:hypothetical protein
MNVVMIIPTGIGCEIGGHAGDATPAARLLASVCDTLILHPNVVNASDINEMPENSLYVEGSILDRFLGGEIELERVRQNKILVAVNKTVRPETINAVSAARATLGIDAQILELDTPLRMIGTMCGQRASGTVEGWRELIEQVSKYDFDALAIASLIEVSRETALYYFENGGVNPWGGVEAIASRLIASEINKPVAHAPIESLETKPEDYKFICDPRMAAELVSTCFLHCVLKGLHKAPRIGKGLSVKDIDVMVSPHGCWAAPLFSCMLAGIPIIEVEENKTIYSAEGGMCGIIAAKNYLEAAGLIACMGAGIKPGSVKRPLEFTKIVN